MRQLSTRMRTGHKLIIIALLYLTPAPGIALGVCRLSLAMATLVTSELTNNLELHDNLTIATGALVTSAIMDLECEKIRPPKWEVESHSLPSFALKMGSWTSLAVGAGIIITRMTSNS